MTPDDLSGLKDDMIAFIEGHGLRRFHGYVDYDEVQAIMWKTGDNTDGWKDFVELAKSSGVPFLTMDSWTLKRDELEELIQRLSNAEYTNDEDLEDARWLRTYVGKTGFVQLGWAYQGQHVSLRNQLRVVRPLPASGRTRRRFRWYPDR